MKNGAKQPLDCCKFTVFNLSNKLIYKASALTLIEKGRRVKTKTGTPSD